jgi:CBS domain containing-hemolysin-like protein
MELLLAFLVIAVLILMNGIFVAAEFAIIGVRPTRIEQLAEEGNRVAKRLRAILRSPAQVDRYIATAQLGITLASLGLGMIGEPAIAHLAEPLLHDQLGLEGEIVHSISFVIALLLITYLHVVLGEMIPKALALQNAERTVFSLAAPMILMQTIFSYPITILNRIGIWVLRVMRVPPPAQGSRLHTPDELELIISESVVGGLIEAEEQQLLSNIFTFGELRVHQIMIPRRKIAGIPITISEQELLETVTAAPHTRFPVYEDTLDNVIGILHLKDVVTQQLENAPFDLRSLLYQAIFVPENTYVSNLLETLKQKHVHMAVVIDEYGGTAGIVTLEDLIEEVVGEVRDEFDVHEQEPITVVQPGHLVVQGTVRLDEITEYVDLGEHPEDVESIGGLMITRLSLPAKIGDHVKINDATLRVEETDGLTVERVSIQFPPPEEDQANSPP